MIWRLKLKNKNLFVRATFLVKQHVPDGLGVRIPGLHPGGSGSIPGLGAVFSVNPVYYF